MTCDPGKLPEIRRRMALTQEALAGKAKLNVRTIQRAEAGKPIDLQTTQEIASALGVTPADILTDSDEVKDPENSEGSFDGETVAVKLRVQPNARVLLDTLSDCLDAKLSCAADLTDKGLEAVKQFCEAVRPVLPELCPAYPVTTESTDEATRLISRLAVVAALNDALKGLQNTGLASFAGTFVDYQKIPRWDHEESCWATWSNQREEAVKIALVTIGPQVRPHLTARVRCNLIPF